MLRFSCPECGLALELDDDSAGAWAVCPECGARVVVPAVAWVPREQAEALVREVAQKCGAKGSLRRLGNFPPDHVANAAARFAHGLRLGETPLAILDSSLMQDCKAGVLLTNRRLYSSLLPYAIELPDIHEVAYETPSAWDQIGLAVLGAHYYFARGRRTFQHRLVVNRETVFVAANVVNARFWIELLTTLAARARQAESAGSRETEGKGC